MQPRNRHHAAPRATEIHDQVPRNRVGLPRPLMVMDRSWIVEMTLRTERLNRFALLDGIGEPEHFEQFELFEQLVANLGRDDVGKLDFDEKRIVSKVSVGWQLEGERRSRDSGRASMRSSQEISDLVA